MPRSPSRSGRNPSLRARSRAIGQHVIGDVALSGIGRGRIGDPPRRLVRAGDADRRGSDAACGAKPTRPAVSPRAARRRAAPAGRDAVGTGRGPVPRVDSAGELPQRATEPGDLVGAVL
jgi:hypothetical protein